MKDFIQFINDKQLMYVVFVTTMILSFVLFYLRNKTTISNYFVSFIKWAKPSLETNDQASPEKIIALIMSLSFITCNIIFMVKIFTLVSDVTHVVIGGLGCLAITGGFILLLLRIISPQQLIELKNGLENKRI